MPDLRRAGRRGLAPGISGAMQSRPDPFLVRAHVPDFEDIGAEFGDERGDTEPLAARSRCPLRAGVAERLACTSVACNAPVHVFLHGGYWRSGSKELYAFLADTVCAAGAIAVIVEYGLMPGTRSRRSSARSADPWAGSRSASQTTAAIPHLSASAAIPPARTSPASRWQRRRANPTGRRRRRSGQRCS